MGHGIELLTKREARIFIMLGEVWDEYNELDVLHPQDKEEFAHAIHQAQNIVCARQVLKTPEQAEREGRRSMIPIEKVKELAPGTKLYRVIGIRMDPERWECKSVTVKNVASVMVMVKEPWLDAEIFASSTRKDHGFVSRCCSLSEKGAWEHCLKDCEAKVKKLKESLTMAQGVADIIRDKVVDMDTEECKG